MSRPTRDLSDAQVIPRLPDSRDSATRGDALPPDLIGATIINFGAAPHEYHFEGGGLIIDYIPKDRSETKRIVLAFQRVGYVVGKVVCGNGYVCLTPSHSGCRSKINDLAGFNHGIAADPSCVLFDYLFFVYIPHYARKASLFAVKQNLNKPISDTFFLPYSLSKCSRTISE